MSWRGTVGLAIFANCARFSPGFLGNPEDVVRCCAAPTSSPVEESGWRASGNAASRRVTIEDIHRAIEQAGGNKNVAAAALRISRKTL